MCEGSAKENASTAQRDDMSRLQQEIESGSFSAKSQFAQVDPYFSKAIDAINKSISTRITGLSQNVGESLVQGGVAKGQDQAGAFYSALAPAIAEGSRQVAGVEQGRALTLADLLKGQVTNLLGANTLENQAISGMKDSTAAGDVFGGVSSLAKIFAALFSSGLFGNTPTNAADGGVTKPTAGGYDWTKD